MKQRRWIVLLVLLVCAVSVACLLRASTGVECRVSREGYRALRPGMTEKEVADLLGVPPGIYTSKPVAAVNSLGVIGALPGTVDPFKSQTWLDDATGVHVDYDSSGKLLRAFAWSHRRRGFLDWLLDRWRTL